MVGAGDGWVQVGRDQIGRNACMEVQVRKAQVAGASAEMRLR